jgi:glyoxylase I family protein
MFKRIDHVELVTANAERAVRFYTEVLGFHVRSRDSVAGLPQGGSLDLVYLELGGTTLELLSYSGSSPAPAPGNDRLGYRMMALEVEDMKKALDYLRAKGVEAVWGPRTRENYARAEIRDPDGNHVELRQWF